MSSSGARRALGIYERVMQGLAGASVGTIVVIMVVQVIARYVFNASLIWAEEVCRYLLIWMTFLFAGYAYHRGELVLLDLFSSKVSPRTYLAIRILSGIPVIVFLCLIIQAGIGHALRFSAQIIPAANFIWMSLTGSEAAVPIFWVYAAVPVGCTILLVHFVARLAYDAWCVASGRPIEAVKSAEAMS